MKKKISLAVVAAITLFFVTCKKDNNDEKPQEQQPPVQTAKTDALNDYKNMYLGSGYSGFKWNGNTTSCSAGVIPQEVLDKALMRIKYFRKAAGLPNDGITMNAALSAKAQQNALMIKANNSISHNPPASWSCYSADGADAAKNGNIAIGASDVENINLWVEDEGANNTEAGHRRWILFSNATKFGFGCTNTSGTLWCINDDVDLSTLPAGTPEFIAWPPKGYVPRPVVYKRWSFGIPAAGFPFQVDFSNAQVTMKNSAGENVTLKIESASEISNSYGGDNTIVWRPSGIDMSSSSDQKYTVNISNVKVNGQTKNYEYDVTLFNP